ncbi:MAG: ATP-dependent DNA helicase [Mycobacteriales bacterium]|nr:ATP-dependent DNA helicase [Mycobacteriales bacterium]
MAPTSAPAVSSRVLSLLETALGVLPGAAVREGQRQMVVAVDRALRNREHLLVQAGTGTGKSLGYLVPALASGRTVVIATATKALQAQLVDKDLPRLVEALAAKLGRTPTYALAKGRSNYLCLQQLHDGPGAREPEQDELFAGPTSDLGRTVLRLREWASETETGDRDEVPFPVADRAWRQVSVSARECLGTKCPDRVDCFAEKARETAKEADIVVANHALLALDAFTGVTVLPEHDAVVIDEAHEFVDSATDALTSELTHQEVRRACAAAKPDLSATVLDRFEQARDAFEGVQVLLQPGWIPQLPDEVRDVLGLVQEAATAAAREVGSGADGDDEVEQATRERVKLQLQGVADAAREIASPSERAAVYVTTTGALRVSPLSVGYALRSQLFGERTVVATSATLTLGGSFRHTAHQLGLDLPATDDDPAPRWDSVDVGSPFDYPRQGQLWIAAELPPPTQPSWAAEVDALLAELLTAAGGRTLGLFSSTAAAARAAESVRAATDLPVLLQGEDSVGALVHAFASDARTCLFGTRSFWQGVDVPGSACQLVVIDRIPFSHVDDPLQKARLADAGSAGFREVSLPPAAVLLAQGAGRLVRATSDRGVVAVLDPRLATAGYSRTLLDTLPGFYRARSKDAVLASLRAIDETAAPLSPVGPPPSQRRRS